MQPQNNPAPTPAPTSNMPPTPPSAPTSFGSQNITQQPPTAPSPQTPPHTSVPNSQGQSTPIQTAPQPIQPVQPSQPITTPASTISFSTPPQSINPGKIIGIVSIILGALVATSPFGVVAGIVSFLRSKKASASTLFGMIGIAVSAVGVIALIIASVAIVSSSVENSKGNDLAQTVKNRSQEWLKKYGTTPSYCQIYTGKILAETIDDDKTACKTINSGLNGVDGGGFEGVVAIINVTGMSEDVIKTKISEQENSIAYRECSSDAQVIQYKNNELSIISIKSDKSTEKLC